VLYLAHRLPIHGQVEVVSMIGNITSIKESPLCIRTWW
jgi:predicted DNA-binding protein with PD1-like motif